MLIIVRPPRLARDDARRPAPDGGDASSRRRMLRLRLHYRPVCRRRRQCLALGLLAWSPSKSYFLTATVTNVESLKLPSHPPITTRISVGGFQIAKLRAFSHHRAQTQEWEPLRKFVEAQADVEVFSLVG